MDLSLPRMDGWEVTRRLKLDDVLRAIPVLALSAHAGQEEKSKAYDAGCVEYLTKPVDRSQLLATIRKHL